MAKTSEELKKMINSTIYQNGAGQITGHGLNLILNELANGVSSGGGVGGGISLIIMDSLSTDSSGSIMPVLSKEGQEKNKKLYDMYISAMENGFIIPIYIDMSMLFKILVEILINSGTDISEESLQLLTLLKSIKQYATISPMQTCIYMDQTFAATMIESINEGLIALGYSTITVDDIVGKYLIIVNYNNNMLGNSSEDSSSTTAILLPNGIVVSPEELNLGV